MHDVIIEGLEKGVLDEDGCYVLTAGDPVGVAGTTNNIRILRAEELTFYKESS